ncbi:MAG: hypothetical protein ABIR79_07410 [Candidatus Binatia bacterium]
MLSRHRLPGFPAYAVLPSGRHVPRRVRVFADFLAAHLRDVARLSRGAVAVVPTSIGQAPGDRSPRVPSYVGSWHE